jgi:hypothetical protein
MKNCNYDDALRFGAIVDAVRELTDGCFANIPEHTWVSICVQYFLNFCDEGQAQAESAALIPDRCRGGFLSGLGVISLSPMPNRPAVKIPIPIYIIQDN